MSSSVSTLPAWSGFHARGLGLPVCVPATRCRAGPPPQLLSSSPTGRGCSFTMFFEFVCGLNLRWTSARGRRVGRLDRTSAGADAKHHPKNQGGNCRRLRCPDARPAWSVCTPTLARKSPRVNPGRSDVFPRSPGCPLHFPRHVRPGPHAGPAPHVRALNQPAAVAAPRARVHGGALLPAPPHPRRAPRSARCCTPDQPRAASYLKAHEPGTRRGRGSCVGQVEGSGRVAAEDGPGARARSLA